MKIVKMIHRPTCDHFYGAMYFLTDDGRVFVSSQIPDEKDNWYEVKIPKNLLKDDVPAATVINEEPEVKYV